MTREKIEATVSATVRSLLEAKAALFIIQAEGEITETATCWMDGEQYSADSLRRSANTLTHALAEMRKA